MIFLSGTRTMAKAVATGAILAALGSVGALKAADDLPIIGDIPMPEVNVDVRIGDDVGFEPLPPRPFPRPRIVYPRGPYAAIPPARYEADIIDRPAVSPHQVAVMLRSTGYSLLGGINRRGWVYTVAVIDPRGDDGRAIIDARTGAIIRFIPAFAVNARLNDELGVIYGPPGPPPLPMREFRQDARTVTGDTAVKRVARRSPEASNVVSRHEPATKQQRDPANARAEMKSESAPTSVQASQPRDLKLWPTQAMPAVQPLD